MSVTAVLRVVLLAGSAAMIAKLFVRGEMARYMSPSLDPLTGLAGAVLAILALAELRRALRPRSAADALADAEDDARHGHDVQGHVVRNVFAYGVALIPVALGLLVTPNVLGASGAAGATAASLLLTFPPAHVVVARSSVGGAPTLAAPIDGVQALLARLRESGEAEVGQAVTVEGVAMRDGSLGAGELAILRYAIVHCVADARPYALLVTGDPGDVPTSQWVRVRGTVERRVQGSERLVQIVAESVEVAPVPANPYLAQ